MNIRIEPSRRSPDTEVILMIDGKFTFCPKNMLTPLAEKLVEYIEVNR